MLSNPYPTPTTSLFSTAQIAERYAQKLTLAPDSKLTERGEALRLFMRKLNPGRIKAGYAPLTEARLGKIFKGKDMAYLYWLDATCEKARSYSRLFNNLSGLSKKKI